MFFLKYSPSSGHSRAWNRPGAPGGWDSSQPVGVTLFYQDINKNTPTDTIPPIAKTNKVEEENLQLWEEVRKKRLSVRAHSDCTAGANSEKKNGWQTDAASFTVVMRMII